MARPVHSRSTRGSVASAERREIRLVTAPVVLRGADRQVQSRIELVEAPANAIDQGRLCALTRSGKRRAVVRVLQLHRDVVQQQLKVAHPELGDLAILGYEPLDVGRVAVTDRQSRREPVGDVDCMRRRLLNEFGESGQLDCRIRLVPSPPTELVVLRGVGEGVHPVRPEEANHVQPLLAATRACRRNLR